MSKPNKQIYFNEPQRLTQLIGANISIIVAGRRTGKMEENLLDGWSFEQTYSTDYMKTLPVRFFCTVKATPKSPVPAIDESKAYKFECSGSCNLAGFTNDGRRIMSRNVPHNEKLQSGGSAMQSFLNKGTKTLVSFEFARE